MSTTKSARKEFEMSEEIYQRMLTKRGPEMLIGGYSTSDFDQMTANDKWKALGKEMGFVWDTARPISGKSDRFFSAIPLEETSDDL